MVLPTDNYPSATAGTTFATHPAGGKEYAVGMLADHLGHIVGSAPAFGLVIPPAAVGASKVYFDLHNGGTLTLRLRTLTAIVATDVAVTGTLGVRLDLFRTSAVGTGGTAATTTASAVTTAPAFWPFDGTSAQPTGVTARTVPTGGATSEQWLYPAYVFTEETAAPSQLAQFFNLLPVPYYGQPITLPAGKGLKVAQGTVASVGTIGFLLSFAVE